MDGRRKSMLSNLLTMSAMLGSGTYSIDPIKEIERKYRKPRPDRYCHTCIIKKDNPSYCEKCRNQE